MNRKELQTIRKRTDKATKGSWFFDGNSLRIKTYWYENHNPVIAEVKVLEWHENHDMGLIEASRNAEFIAHAREDVPKLLDEVERLREALKWYAVEDLTTIGDIARRALES